MRPGEVRVILRRMDGGGPSPTDAVRQVNAANGVTVIDEKPSALLVEGEAGAIDALARSMLGWRAFPVTRIPVPDARPRILQPRKS
jgi:hypothetical protein